MEDIQKLKTDERALSKFISAQEEWVKSIAVNYLENGLSLEQLVQEGDLGVMAAVRNYDEKKNIPFRVFALKFVVGHIKDALEENRKYKTVGSMELDTMTDREKERVPELQDWSSANYSSKHRTATDIAEDLLSLLSERDAWVVRWQFGIGDVDGKSVPVAEIARRLNLTPRAVNKIKNNALDIFRESELSKELWFALRGAKRGFAP